MQLDVRRSRRGTFAALVNLALAWVTGVVVIGNQLVRAETSVVWLVVGGLLLLWGAMILSGLLRPVKLIADDDGVTLVRLLGRHRFRWEELTSADFERSEKFAVIAATVAGQARFAALATRGLQPEALARAKAMIWAKRPDLAPEQTESAEGGRRDGL